MALSAIALNYWESTIRADCAGKLVRLCRRTHRAVVCHGLAPLRDRVVSLGEPGQPVRSPANGCRRSRYFGSMRGWSRAIADSNVQSKFGAQKAGCDTTSSDPWGARTSRRPNS